MVNEQPGSREGAEQSGSSQTQTQPQQLTSSQSNTAPRAPGFAAFGTSGGAAIMFRDLASI